MVVANRGPAPLTLSVYAADGFTTDAGQLDLLTRDKKSIAIGAWVKAERRQRRDPARKDRPGPVHGQRSRRTPRPVTTSAASSPR